MACLASAGSRLSRLRKETAEATADVGGGVLQKIAVHLYFLIQGNVDLNRYETVLAVTRSKLTKLKKMLFGQHSIALAGLYAQPLIIQVYDPLRRDIRDYLSHMQSYKITRITSKLSCPRSGKEGIVSSYFIHYTWYDFNQLLPC